MVYFVPFLFWHKVHIVDTHGTRFTCPQLTCFGQTSYEHTTFLLVFFPLQGFKLHNGVVFRVNAGHDVMGSCVPIHTVRMDPYLFAVALAQIFDFSFENTGNMVVMTTMGERMTFMSGFSG
jgi:hypothetical protein